MTRITIASLLLVGTVAGSASADVIYQNLPVSALGGISEAFGSNGTYAFGQSGAQRFSLEDTYNLSTLSWWGSSQNFSGLDLGNFSGFEVVIWNADFSAQVAHFDLAIGSLTTSATGNTNFFGSPEYLFSSSIAGMIGPGTYNMNIGAVLANGQGDEFIWSAGADENSFFTSPAQPWGTWLPIPPGIGDDGLGSFRLEGSTVPAPGAVALLGLASLRGRRRAR